MNLTSFTLDFTRTPPRRTRRGPVQACGTGCGTSGTRLLAQAASVPHLEMPAVADRHANAAHHAYRFAGVPDEAILVCDNRHDSRRAVKAEQRVIAADPLRLMELPLGIIVEATGRPEAGARQAEAARRHSKHVAMVNKEADAAVGHLVHGR